MDNNSFIPTVIIDDDQASIDNLLKLIEVYCPKIEVLGTAHNIEEGAKEILVRKPKIVFLDVEMPNGSGFDLLRMMKTKDFEVIFITAHNKYAINAIKHSALDYLLKPIDAKEFIETSAKITASEYTSFPNYDVLFENLSNHSPKKLTVASSKGHEYIPIDSIVRLESERSYARIFLLNGRIIMVSKCLNDYQAMLDNKVFFRIHNSHLINLNHVVMYVRNDGGYVEMVDNSHIPISRTKKELFINTMQQFIS